MALTTCKECGKEISDTAFTCPQCGSKRRIGVLGRIGLGCLGFIVVLVELSIIANVMRPKPTDLLKPTRATKGDCLTCGGDGEWHGMSGCVGSPMYMGADIHKQKHLSTEELGDGSGHCSLCALLLREGGWWGTFECRKCGGDGWTSK